MGLLDDAIREHLDLKRRRGADPTEIERAEREALGPVRRGPEVGGDDAPPAEPEASAETDAAVSSAPAEQWGEPFPEDTELHEAAPATEDHEEMPPYEPPDQAEPEPLAGPPPFDAELDAPPPHPADLAPAPEPNPAPHPADPPPSHLPPHLDQETEEYDLEPEDEEGDDVLESTPEFLQDAPDHDRLWFEQRPPRDFDFDG